MESDYVSHFCTRINVQSAPGTATMVTETALYPKPCTQCNGLADAGVRLGHRPSLTFDLGKPSVYESLASLPSMSWALDLVLIRRLGWYCHGR